MRKSLSVLVVSALVFAACGNDDGDSPGAGSNSAVVDGSADEPAAEPTEEPADDPVDEAGGDEAGGDESGGDESGGDEQPPDDNVNFVGDSNSDWCIAARDVSEASDEFEAIGFGDPEQLEKTMNDMIGKMEVARSFTPPELLQAVETSFDAFGDLKSALEPVDFNILDLDLAVLDDPDGSIEAAGDLISAYNEQVCGIESDDDSVPVEDGDGGDDGSGFDQGDGTIREQAVAGLVQAGLTEAEAGCIIDNVDLDDPTALTDPTVLIGVLGVCEIPPERIAELGG